MWAAVCTEKLQYGTILCILRCPLEKKGGKMSCLTLRAVGFQPEVPYCNFSISRFHYSGTRVYARISCSNHVLIHRINHSDRSGDQSPTFFPEIFPSLLPRLNRDSIIWQKDRSRVLNILRAFLIHFSGGACTYVWRI